MSILDSPEIGPLIFEFASAQTGLDAARRDSARLDFAGRRRIEDLERRIAEQLAPRLDAMPAHKPLGVLRLLLVGSDAYEARSRVISAFRHLERGGK